MLEFFYQVFCKSPHWAVFFVSMCPMVESKVAIPFGLTKQIWGSLTLSPFTAIVMAFLGSLLPCVLVIAVCKFIKKHTCGLLIDGAFNKFQQKYSDKFEKLDRKQSILKKCILLASFVAIPLPLTGVYAGSVIAGLSNLKFWQGFLSVAIGEVLSCTIVLGLCTVFENSTFYIFIVSLAICLLYIVGSLLISFINKFKNKKRKEM